MPSVALVIGLTGGILCGSKWIAPQQIPDYNEALRHMNGQTASEKDDRLRYVLSEIGATHSLTCEAKVKKMHRLIEAGQAKDGGPSLGDLVASIILEGSECNEILYTLINSRQSLPDFGFYDREFIYGHLHGSNYGARFGDEQALVLWMLGRMNPGVVVPVSDLQFDIIFEGEPEEKGRAISRWKKQLLFEWDLHFSSHRNQVPGS